MHKAMGLVALVVGAGGCASDDAEETTPTSRFLTETEDSGTPTPSTQPTPWPTTTTTDTGSTTEEPMGFVAYHAAPYAGCSARSEDRFGHVVETTYDDYGWPVRIEDSDGEQVFTYVREQGYVVSMTTTGTAAVKQKVPCEEQVVSWTRLEQFNELQHVINIRLAETDACGTTTTTDTVYGLVYEVDRLAEQDIETAEERMVTRYDACEKEDEVFTRFADGREVTVDLQTQYADDTCRPLRVTADGPVWLFEDGRLVATGMEGFGLDAEIRYTCP